ncbi:MAG: AAA family ATPase [Pseudomonadota bacterium]
MHLKRILLFPEKYPTDEYYPFNKNIFRKATAIDLHSPVTFFLGENGTGKSTLLEALAYRCGIHIWRDTDRIHLEKNPYEKWLHRFIAVEWTDGVVAGSFFSSALFGHFAQNLDEWAASDPAMLGYFGGKSLVAQSHGQSLMSYFRARYQIRGLYLLDEPETALSPRSQLDFVKMLKEIGQKGYAQFIIATHSPMILACPGAEIYSFNEIPIRPVDYEETEHYRIYRDFMKDPAKYL